MNEDGYSKIIFRKVNNTKCSAIRKRKEVNNNSSDSELESHLSYPLDNRNKQIQTHKIIKKKKIFTTKKKHQHCLQTKKKISDSDEDFIFEVSNFNSDAFSSTKTKEIYGPFDMGATARSEIDTEHSKDAQAQFERVQIALKDQKPLNCDNSLCYKGIAMYGAKTKSDTAKGSASNGLNRVGPIRATQYMRSSVRWDYAPDICKDYKETGYCTFGDSCKFMHDRSDYKHGWQLEKEWEKGNFIETNEDKYLVSDEDNDLDEITLPSNCFICRKIFVNPVITKCKHYFCEACILNHSRITKKCAVCNINTEDLVDNSNKKNNVDIMNSFKNSNFTQINTQ